MSRIVAIIGALAGLAALALQFVILYQNMTAGGATPLEATWRFVGFFTILTNVIVTVIFAVAALRANANTGVNAPRIEAAGAVAIIMVMIIYHVLLANLWKPEGAQLVADLLLHTATPILFALYWLIRPHGALKWTDVLICLIWPLAYCIYALIRGSFDGWYAYPFLNPSTTETPQLLVNIAGMTAAFAVATLVLVAIDRALGRRTQPATA